MGGAPKSKSGPSSSGQLASKGRHRQPSSIASQMRPYSLACSKIKCHNCVTGISYRRGVIFTRTDIKAISFYIKGRL